MSRARKSYDRSFIQRCGRGGRPDAFVEPLVDGRFLVSSGIREITVVNSISAAIALAERLAYGEKEDV
jgi:hypothetical protein